MSCQSEVITPSCDFIEAKRTGERIEIKIYSDEPMVKMCRELVGGTLCQDLQSNFYNCIRVRGSAGDVIQFSTPSVECEIIIE